MAGIVVVVDDDFFRAMRAAFEDKQIRAAFEDQPLAGSSDDETMRHRSNRLHYLFV